MEPPPSDDDAPTREFEVVLPEKASHVVIPQTALVRAAYGNSVFVANYLSRNVVRVASAQPRMIWPGLRIAPNDSRSGMIGTGT